MGGFDPNRIALVVAKPVGGRAGSSREVVGTGYFLTGDVVLTARHVAGDPDRSLRVRAEVGGSERDRWTDAVPIWRDPGDIDAMLLRTSRSFEDWEAPTFPAIVEGRWKSSGFAAATEDQEAHNRKTLPLNGSFAMSLGQGPPELSLWTEQSIASAKEHYWKGISGAPVFAEDGSGLVGVITDASRPFSNGLVGLPVTRLLDDIRFRSIIRPSFLGSLPSTPWCLVLTAENSKPDLKSKIEGVLIGFREKDPLFHTLHQGPVTISVLGATKNVENWATTVEALARANFLIADVSTFEPAVMLLLGIRSVLRRGVTISVTKDELPSPARPVPFNVQETRVLPYKEGFYKNLHRAMVEGAANLERDANYLDLPAYHAVRAPRPETWADEDKENILVLCPFGEQYSTFYKERLQELIQAFTGDKNPQRMLDLRSPRLVGQALYEQIRWSSRCIVDWTGWRPNVFFELGVRLACSEQDPLCIIDQRDQNQDPANAELSPDPLRQRTQLLELFEPVAYGREQPHGVLSEVLERWIKLEQAKDRAAPTPQAVPMGGTFAVAQTSFLWRQDGMLDPPHVEERRRAERIFGKNPELRPERLTLFGANHQFDAQLRDAVREKWIAARLYLRHLSDAAEECPDDVRAELRVVGGLAQDALRHSLDPRHVRLRKEIRAFLRAERSPPRTRGNGGQDD